MDVISSLPPISTNASHGYNERHTPTRRNLVPRQTSVGLGANQSNLPMFQANEGVSVDEKLNEQFRYFRSEYVEAANTSGVAVPLVIVEDKSGQVFKFVLHGGPKYLFEVIQANLENIHLLRCSLSLLIIIITLLRRKLPDPATHREPPTTSFLPHPGSIATTDSIGAWVVDTLARIGDAAAVSICINILITSYNPSVQELALSLLASILMVSDEAVTQMLLPYSSSGTVVPLDSANDTSRRSSSKRTSLTADTNYSAYTVEHMAHVTDPVPAPTVDFKKLNFSYNTMDYSVKKIVQEKPKKSEKNSSCLSYVLSVILLQKNRHLLAAGCADIILAMLRKNKREMSESISMSCTCELPAIDERSSKNEKTSLSKLTYNAQPEENSPHSSNPLSSVVLEWAGLKLLLKFLFRYEKMSAQSKTATKAIVRESVSASLHLKDEYAYAHSRVFTAVCQLIASSPTVATYTNTLAGAEDLLLFTYNRFDPTDETHYNTLVACTNALNEDKLQQQRRHAQLSYMRDHPHEQVMPAPGDPRLDVYIRDPSHVRTSQHSEDARHRLKTPGGSVSPSKATSNSSRASRHGKKVSKSLDAARDGRLGTGPRTEVQSESIELTRNFKVNFQGAYEVETEKRELYLLNSYDAKYGTNNNTDLKKMSRDADRLKSQTPLSYHPNNDNLIDSSLERIGSAALRPITVPRSTPMTEAQRRETEFLLGTSQNSNLNQNQQSHELSAFQSTASSTPFKSSLLSPSPLAPLVGGHSITSSNDSSSYPGRGMYHPPDDELVFRSSQDFFGAMKHKPVIPQRIEPKDVITEGEPLHLIRKKFAKLAEEAKSRGETRTKAEAEKNSQQEKIQRVYGPKKFKFYDPLAPSPNYGEDGEIDPDRPMTKGRSRTSTAQSQRRSGKSGSGARESRGGGGPPPIEEGDLFASFTDASGTALQDLPIQSQFAAKSRNGNSNGINVYGMEGMEFSVENAPLPEMQPLSHQGSSFMGSSTASDGPEVYGLRLENFDFDEANLFDGFKPIFSYAPKESETTKNPLDPSTLKELGIGRKNKPDLEMAQTVDLILS